MGCCVTFMRLWLKVSNFLLLAIGLFMALYSLYAYHNFEELKKHGNGTEVLYTSAAPLDGDLVSPGLGVDAIAFASSALPADLPSMPNISFLNNTKVPVFITGFGGAGLFTMLTAANGIYATDSGSHCCLSFYTLQLFLMIAIQAAVVVLIFEHKVTVPDDQKDAAASKILDWMKHQQALFKWLALGILGVQVSCIFTACCLKSSKWKPRDEFDDLDDIYSHARGGTSNASEPLLHVNASPKRSPRRKKNNNGKQDDNEWSKRMYEKYGLDTSHFSYSPVKGDQDGADNDSKKCTIM